MNFTGAVLSPPDRRDWFAPRVAKASAVVLPQESLPWVRPPVLDQGSEGTCVGHAVASLLTWAAIRAGFRRQCSPRDSYELARNIMMPPVPAEGADVRSALLMARRLGVCEERFRPYRAGHPAPTSPEADESRPDNKLAGFARVESECLRAMREAMCVHGPLIAVVMAREGLMHPRAGHMASFTGDSNGPHAMLLLGYDDRRQAFLAQNSWGDAYGDKGRVWLPYGDYPIQEAWCPFPDVAEDRPAEVPFIPWWERAAFLLPWWT